MFSAEADIPALATGHAAAADEGESAPPPLLRAFVVEDSGIILGNLSETLAENTPVRVVGSADDEESGYAWLDTHAGGCDLVIVDIFLKAGSGLGLLRRLRDRAEPPLRVVLSNHATAEIRQACLALGVDQVFDKSNEIDEMLGWLRRLPREAAAARLRR